MVDKNGGTDATSVAQASRVVPLDSVRIPMSNQGQHAPLQVVGRSNTGQKAPLNPPATPSSSAPQQVPQGDGGEKR